MNIKAKIDKAKIDSSKEKVKRQMIILLKIKDRNQLKIAGKLNYYSEEQALQAQIFGCWSVPLGLPLCPR